VPDSHTPQRLGSVLDGLIERYGYRERLDAARAVEAWPEVAGEAVAAQTEQVWMRHGVLHVKVRSAAWRHHLSFGRSGWRDRMNEHLGRAVVDEVEFR
jgi:predicted nucleic acid-binding Zn ribbon protein